MLQIVGSVLEVSRSEISADFEWRGFRPEDLERRGEWLSSPLLSFAGWKWQLWLRREDPSNGSSPVTLSLGRIYGLSSTPVVRYWLGAVKAGEEREEEEIARGRREPGDGDAVEHPWLRFSELQRRMERSASSSGTLSFFIRLRSGPETDPETGGASSSATRQQETTGRDSEGTLILREHLKKFLSADDRDVLFKVKDKEFRAHKNFLRARSPVFEAMFSHDMRENEEDTVTVDDVDPDCFGEFLAYIYTGEVEEMSPTNAVGLFYAADKYDFPHLKRRCADVLKASLSTSLVCDVIALAATHGEQELLESAMAFFTEHQEAVMETVEWQRFALSNPIRASEVCLAAVKRYRASQNQN